MTRRCSHCSNNGHNSRTCPQKGGGGGGGGVRLFGVRLNEGPIRKSVSMGNLSHKSSNESGGDHDHALLQSDGYASEDFVHASPSTQRKKGTPWTEEEHRMFLLGLQKLGKGDWRGISRNYVMSRTPTQVASHAQKYFIRQSNSSRRKRRSSLFDIIALADESVETPMESHDFFPIEPQQAEPQTNAPLPLPPSLDEECESMDSTLNSSELPLVPPPNPEPPQCLYPVVFPAYIPQFLPYPIPFWPEPVQPETHEVLKPTAVHSKSPINVDELVGMSKLSLAGSLGDSGPSSLSLKLPDGTNRQSAFHTKPETGVF